MIKEAKVEIVTEEITAVHLVVNENFYVIYAWSEVLMLQ